jgi:hypothetical protein
MKQAKSERPAPSDPEYRTFADPWRTWTPEMMLQFALREGPWDLRPGRPPRAPGLSMKFGD